MKKAIIVIVALAIVVWIYTSSTSKPEAGTPGTTTTTTTTVTTPTGTKSTDAKDGSILNSNGTTDTKTVTSSNNVAPTAVVDIRDFKFGNAPLTIKKGTTVTWTNNDGAPHTVTSDTGTILKSPTLAKGETFSYTFTTVGTYAYHCTVHPTMKSSVTVTN